MNNEFEIKLLKLLKKINVNINNEQIELFYNYMNLLLEWNKRINLTAIIEQDDIILKHFVDSLEVLNFIEKNKRIVDIGTGAGFPGIPLSIMNKESNFTLVDSLNKRINFLEEVKNNLGLDNVNTVHMRAEDFGKNKNYREKYDYAVSRAVANMSVLVEFLLPTVKVGGKVICMKGSKLEAELKDSKNAIKKLGGQIVEIKEFCLPESDITRNIVIIKKIKPTPNQYPRKAGLPNKQPIK